MLAAALLAVAGAAPCWADGLTLYSSGGGVFDYALTTSSGDGITFQPNSDVIVLSGMSGVTGATLSGDLAAGPAGGFTNCGLHVTAVSSSSVTVSNSGFGVPCVFQGPAQWGTLEVVATVATLGTVNFALLNTPNGTISGTTQGPAPPVFAGTPGYSNCVGVSVAALARQYGGISAAATALGYPSVRALQTDIKTYCQV